MIVLTMREKIVCSLLKRLIVLSFVFGIAVLISFMLIFNDGVSNNLYIHVFSYSVNYGYVSILLFLFLGILFSTLIVLFIKNWWKVEC